MPIDPYMGQKGKRFEMVLWLRGGHKFFWDHANQYRRFAVADQSGDTPYDTTDGPLWLDTDREAYTDEESGRAFVPIVNECGDESYTPMSWVHAKVACVMFGLKLDGVKV